MPGEVLYYVHHHGAGHGSRARAVCEEFPGPVTLISSLPEPDDLPSWQPRPGRVSRSWVQVPLDVWPDADPAPYRDPDAGGRLHWVPLYQPGLQDRNAAVLETIRRIRPRLLVADVSVEIAVLARISGVPVVPVLLPGERTDPAHRLALDLAVAVLAPWPRPRRLPGWLEPWQDKIHFTGGIRAAGTDPAILPAAHGASRTVLPAFGATGPPSMLSQAAAATPDWRWLRPDPTAPGGWPAALAAADVVVAHAGLGTVADLAAVGARCVILPQERPFDEQRATGELLRQLGIGPVVVPAPRDDEWPGLLERAATSDPDWSAWEVQQGARAAARLLQEIAR